MKALAVLNLMALALSGFMWLLGLMFWPAFVLAALVGFLGMGLLVCLCIVVLASPEPRS